RLSAQPAERDGQRRRNGRGKTGHTLVDLLERSGHLTANGVERGRRAGIGGAHQCLERSRRLLLNLLERRQIAQRGVELVEGGETFLGRTARHREGIPKRSYVALQILEPRREHDAKLIVCVEQLANERNLAVAGSNAPLRDSDEGGEVGAHLVEGHLN